MLQPPNRKANKASRPHRLAVPASMPSVIDPMLPTLVMQPFSNPEYLFEPKLDGYRAICFLQDGRVRFLSRKGHSLTERFPALRRICTSVKASSAIIDGEVVALDEQGRPCFEGLHGRSRNAACVTVFFAFDLLYLDGYNLTQCPLIARKAALKRILPKRDTDRIRYTAHVVGSGEQLFKEIEKLQLEGMVAKRKDSVYSCGRSRLWQKVKTTAGRIEMQKRSEAWR